MGTLSEMVDAATEVAAVSARNAKVAALAGFLTNLVASSGSLQEELAPAIGFLIGEPRQGRIGVGWATVAKTVVQPAESSTLRIADLDQLLGAVEATSGPGSVADRAALLTNFLSEATAAESDFVRRLLIGDLRQGALAGVMTTAIAKAAGVPVGAVRRAAMLLGELPPAGVIALTDGVDGLARIRLEVGRPVLPMLAATSPDVASAMAEISGPASVEWKLDGARIQVHKSGEDIQIYTRNLNQVTARLPEVVDIVRSLPADKLILDGEILGLMTDETAGAFQDTMSRFGTDGAPDTSASSLRPFFFDVMLHDEADLLHEPLHVRLEVLQKVAPGHTIPQLSTEDSLAAQRHLDDALSARHEGVMIKGLDTKYEAGRRGKGWRKVKPVYTLDLVVLGAEWGHGRRKGWLSNLHLGARDPQTGDLVMVGKTFKGLTDDLLKWQTKAFLEREVERQGITVFIRKELVVEIALDGAQRSTRYPGGVALRFARVKGYRPDKNPDDADTLDAVRNLLPGQ